MSRCFTSQHVRGVESVKLRSYCQARQARAEVPADISRRQLALLTGLLSFPLPQPKEAHGGVLPPFVQQPAVGAPIRFPRKKLDLKFAVLMMHSVYEAVDQLSLVPSTEFQSRFWKRRQKEYEPYLAQYKPIQVKQGDLTDPYYFDFISFTQVSTVAEDILSTVPASQRPILLSGIQNRIGDLIFEGMRDGFRDEIFDGPSELPAGTHIDRLTVGVQQLLDVFVQKGFALKASASDIVADCKEGSCDYHGANGSRGKFSISISGPADLWGMSTATARGCNLMPDFVAFAVDGFLRASKACPTYSASLATSAITQKWSLV